MVQVVFIDVLFAVNLILNYFILLAVSGVLHRHDKRLRLFLGAALGAAYSIFIFFPQVSFLYSALLKVVFSITIVAVAYKFATLRNLIKLVIIFYIISFLFGGIIFAVYLFVTPPGMMVRNGVVYIDISPLVLILSGAGCYITITLVSRIFNKIRKVNSLYDIFLEMDGRSAKMKALMDTGNTLTDAITGSPVIIAEYGPLERLIPPELRETFKTGIVADTNTVSGSAWAGRFRMIPYGSVGAVYGLLPAFKPDRLTIITKEGKTAAEGVLVAVSGKSLCSDGSYCALLSPMMLNAFSHAAG
jgi:stage II sporulation protein GA (sporulation sigma-E factor processing peptidase)